MFQKNESLLKNEKLADAVGHVSWTKDAAC